MVFRNGAVALVVATMIVLVGPASSRAAAPVLKHVGSTQRRPSAKWTLPQGVTSEVIEIATKRDTGYDGYFVAESAVVFDLLRPKQRSWRDPRPLRPGTFYLHVKGADFTGCGLVPLGACDSFWSNTLTLRIASHRQAYLRP